MSGDLAWVILWVALAGLALYLRRRRLAKARAPKPPDRLAQLAWFEQKRHEGHW